MTDIFEAAKKGDIAAVKQFIAAGVDVNTMNDYKFTALHCAAMGANSADNANIVEIMLALINAGSNLERLGGGGRTALYLAAEFSKSLAPVQALLEAGAKADIEDEHGNHIVNNAMMPDVQALLSKITGEPIPAPKIETPPIKMSTAQWNAAKLKVDAIFDELNKAGLIALQNAGTTQDDGFSDCAELFQAQGGATNIASRDGANTGLQGFCFYTGQDQSRAKRTSQLSLAFWGAPEGAPKDMQRVGKLIVDTFKQHGFTVNWNGSGNMRPTVYLLE